jgi:hypothetical protein
MISIIAIENSQNHIGYESMREGTFWCSEMEYLTIFFEHVDFLNCLDRLYIQLLQSSLQFLVIGSGTLVSLFHFSAWCALSTDSDGCSLSLELC